MKFFGFRLTAKREPRYPSYAQFEALSSTVQDLSDGLQKVFNATESMRKKVYREEQKGQIAEIIEGDGKQRRIMPTAPGEIMTPEQVIAIFQGRG